jgi:hypothetical protein
MSVKISQSSNTCGYCNNFNPDAKVCGNCHLVRYCNPECQRLAWRTHKTVCKPPENQSISIFTGYKLDKTIQTRAWTKAQVEEMTTRPTDFISRGKEVKSIPLDPLTLGLKKNQDKLMQLLKDEKYSELFDHIEAETDRSFKIDWLTLAANAAHVPMMMALVGVLIEKISQGQRSQGDIEEAIKWYYLGMHCTRLDLACNEDASTEDAVSSFAEKGEQLRQLLTEEQQKRYTSDAYKLKIIRAWVPQETHPSPKWLAYHGLMYLMGINTLKPQDQWFKLRTEKHRELTHSDKNS